MHKVTWKDVAEGDTVYIDEYENGRYPKANPRTTGPYTVVCVRTRTLRNQNNGRTMMHYPDNLLSEKGPSAQLINLPVGNIQIELKGCNGILTSNLKEPPAPHDDEYQYEKYSAAVDALEALVLAHACQGVDVEAEDYVLGLQTAYDKIAQVFS